MAHLVATHYKYKTDSRYNANDKSGETKDSLDGLRSLITANLYGVHFLHSASSISGARANIYVITQYY